MRSTRWGLLGAFIGILIFPIAIFVAMYSFFYDNKKNTDDDIEKPVKTQEKANTYHNISQYLQTPIPEKLITKNKQDYLKAGYFEPYWVTKDNISELCKYYQEKGIPIYHQYELRQPDSSRYDNMFSSVPPEINYIQSKIKQKELPGRVGYILSGYYDDRGHAEALIITEDQIIKPIVWNVRGNQKFDPEDYGLGIAHRTMIHHFHDSSKAISPQAIDTVCGTLCFAYLKNYLKNDGMQLKEYCLSIPYYNKQNQLQYLFFPSPHVLRYSQSSTFIHCIAAMLEDKDKVTITRTDNTTMTIETLQYILKTTYDQAIAQQNEKISIESKNRLEELPNYRKKWLEEFNKIKERRNAMNFEQYNRWLNYTSQRYHVLAVERKFGNKIDDLLKQYKIEGICKKYSDCCQDSSEEIGLFCRKTNIDFNSLKPLIKVMFSKIAPNEYILFYSILKSDQKITFLPQLKQEYFEYIKNETPPIDKIFHWLNCFKIETCEVSNVLDQSVGKEIVKETIKNYVLNTSKKSMSDFLSCFKNNEQRLSFLWTYFSNSSLYDLLIELYKVHRPNNISLFFIDEKLEADFVKQHLPPGDIQTWIKTIPFNLSINFTMKSYLNYFDHDEQANILFS